MFFYYELFRSFKFNSAYFNTIVPNIRMQHSLMMDNCYVEQPHKQQTFVGPASNKVSNSVIRKMYKVYRAKSWWITRRWKCIKTADKVVCQVLIFQKKNCTFFRLNKWHIMSHIWTHVSVVNHTTLLMDWNTDKLLITELHRLRIILLHLWFCRDNKVKE